MRILVGQGSCGIAAGANKVYTALETALVENNIEAKPLSTGCIGVCFLEPIIEIIDDGGVKYTYVKVSAEAAPHLLNKTIRKTIYVPNRILNLVVG